MRESTKEVDPQRRRIIRGAATLAVASLGVGVSAHRARGGEGASELVVIQRAAIRADDVGSTWVLDADLQWGELPPQWEALVAKGVALPFAITFRLWQQRWWWPDEAIWGKRWPFQWQYRPSTRLWWLVHQGEVIAQGGWREVVAPLERIRGWTLLERNRLAPNAGLVAELTVGLDEGALGPVLRLPSVEARDALQWQGRPYRWRPWG